MCSVGDIYTSGGRSVAGKNGSRPRTCRAGLDLLLWKPERGFVALELKVGKDKPTPAQDVVLKSLADAGAVVGVVYPRDLKIVAELLGPIANAPRES